MRTAKALPSMSVKCKTSEVLAQLFHIPFLQYLFSGRNRIKSTPSSGSGGAFALCVGIEVTAFCKNNFEQVDLDRFSGSR